MSELDEILYPGDPIGRLRAGLPDLPARDDGRELRMPRPSHEPIDPVMAGLGRAVPISPDRLAAAEDAAVLVGGLGDGGLSVGNVGAIIGRRMAARLPARQKQMDEADRLFRLGASNSQVFHDTGAFRGLDGHQRVELPDAPRDFHGTMDHGHRWAAAQNPPRDNFGTQLGQIYGDPEFYRAAPGLREMPVAFTLKGGDTDARWLRGAAAAYVRDGGADVTGRSLNSRPHKSEMILMNYTPGDLLMTSQRLRLQRYLHHEGQHMIAQREGHDPGSGNQNPNDPDYWLNPGELEARMAERRMMLTPAQRSMRFPFAMQELAQDPELLHHMTNQMFYNWRNNTIRELGGFDPFRAVGGLV